jgi:hypothetical protein
VATEPELLLAPAARRAIDRLDSSSQEELAVRLNSFFRNEERVASTSKLPVDPPSGVPGYREARISRRYRVIFRELNSEELRDLEKESPIKGYYIMDIKDISSRWKF